MIGWSGWSGWSAPGASLRAPVWGTLQPLPGRFDWGRRVPSSAILAARSRIRNWAKACVPENRNAVARATNTDARSREKNMGTPQQFDWFRGLPEEDTAGVLRHRIFPRIRRFPLAAGSLLQWAAKVPFLTNGL